MQTMKSFVLAGAAAATIALASSAAAAGPEVQLWNGWTLNNQQLYANTFSNLQLNADWIGGDVRATSVAIGNNLAMVNVGNNWTSSEQINMGDVGATLKAYVASASGETMDFSAVGICNNGSHETKDGGFANMTTAQRCNTTDPFAIAHVDLGTVTNDVSVSAVAMANNFSAVEATRDLKVNSGQINVAAVYSEAIVNASNAAGDVAVTAAAIGNNLSITQSRP